MVIRFTFFIAVLVADGVVPLRGQSAARALSPETAFAARLPAYAPTDKVSGHISLWGHGSFKRDFMGKLVARWIAEFGRAQPGVTFENRMYGTASAIGALHTGAGNIALLGEEISPAAAAAFERAKGYAPTGIQVATGSLDVNFFDYAHMIFVHRDNPIASLDLAQLDAIFGTERRRGAAKDLRTWGDLGLDGEWAAKKIQPYGWKVDEDFALFFREAVLENSHRWNPAIKEYVHTLRADGTQYDHGQQILDALARDPAGIAISNVRYARPEVKPLALAARSGAPTVAPTPENLIAQAYPLARIIPAFIDRAPGQPVEPAVREFLRFVLSREGQEALIAETGYLPLGAEAIRGQLAKLAEHEGSARRQPALRPTESRTEAPHYQAGVGLPPPADTAKPGVLRIAGPAALGPLLARWREAFQKNHPATRLETRLDGSDVAIDALSTRHTDLAVLGREATAAELKAYEWIYRRKPARVEVATGGLDRPGHSPAIALFVHRDNPLTSLTLAQVDALFSTERRRGAPAALATWGDLGLGGSWGGVAVRLYAPDTESATGRFFRAVALGDSRSLHWDRIVEFTDTSRPRAPSHDAARRTLAALGADPHGLAVGSLGASNVNVKPIALDGMAVDRESVIARRYPLARGVVAYFHGAKDQPPHPDAAEFLRFILSETGQECVVADTGYLPLSEVQRSTQRAGLD